MNFKKLGLDLGTKSLGIAISDSLNLMAYGRENFQFPLNQFEFCFKQISYYLKTENIDTIVLGYPLLPSGDKSSTTIMVENFYKELITKFDQKIILWNESYSTSEAEAILIQADLSRQKRKQKKDLLAATIVLQHYLDYLNYKK